jgi:hypothetical protein
MIPDSLQHPHKIDTNITTTTNHKHHDNIATTTHRHT